MNVAIVGTSMDLTENEERDVRQMIALILQSRYGKSDTVISGGAKGVDTFAIEIAKGLGMPTKIYPPEKPEKRYYFKRNAIIAKECDELHCFSIPCRKTKCYHHEEEQEHEKTAGCWTMNEAEKLNKPCQLVVTVKR